MDFKITKIKIRLGIGQILKWEEIDGYIPKLFVPADIQIICESCFCRSYGVVRKVSRKFMKEKA